MQSNNVFAAILAGGSGTRMGNPDKPKQFLMLGSKPILIHTIEKFCVMGVFDAVLVLCPDMWIWQTEDLIKKYGSDLFCDVIVTPGGCTRNDTVMNAVLHIEENYETNEESILVTHDAVRPFVTHRVIKDNLSFVQEFGACDTVIPATDTIVESLDGVMISDVPDRRNFYQGQTPQSFKLQKLKRLMQSLSEKEKESLTDACKIFTLRGEGVALVAGEPSNIKITYPQDMRVAQALLGE